MKPLCCAPVWQILAAPKAAAKKAIVAHFALRGKLKAAPASFASERRKKYTFPMRYYSSHAQALYEKYRRLDAEAMHENWLAHLPESPGLACDIGAASGRDANWLAEKGWDVIAVEPCAEFRKLAQPSNDPRVSWLDDRLPDLKQLRKLGSRFDLILVSAVWMHLPPHQQGAGFQDSQRIAVAGRRVGHFPSA